jgi:hypothetical protein
MSRHLKHFADLQFVLNQNDQTAFGAKEREIADLPLSG